MIPTAVLAIRCSGVRIATNELLRSIFSLFFIASSLALAGTERFFRTGKARYLPSDIRVRAGQRLLQLDAAREVQDLRLPPSNNLEKLAGDRKGQCAWSPADYRRDGVLDWQGVGSDAGLLAESANGLRPEISRRSYEIQSAPNQTAA